MPFWSQVWHFGLTYTSKYRALNSPGIKVGVWSAWMAVLDVADEPENEETFGRPGASRGDSAYPQIRFVSLIENGTHVLFGSQMSDYPSCSNCKICLRTASNLFSTVSLKSGSF